jgi:hypothetical protein
MASEIEETERPIQPDFQQGPWRSGHSMLVREVLQGQHHMPGRRFWNIVRKLIEIRRH